MGPVYWAFLLASLSSTLSRTGARSLNKRETIKRNVNNELGGIKGKPFNLDKILDKLEYAPVYEAEQVGDADNASSLINKVYTKIVSMSGLNKLEIDAPNTNNGPLKKDNFTLAEEVESWSYDEKHSEITPIPGVIESTKPPTKDDPEEDDEIDEDGKQIYNTKALFADNIGLEYDDDIITNIISVVPTEETANTTNGPTTRAIHKRHQTTSTSIIPILKPKFDEDEDDDDEEPEYFNLDPNPQTEAKQDIKELTEKETVDWDYDSYPEKSNISNSSSTEYKGSIKVPPPGGEVYLNGGVYEMVSVDTIVDKPVVASSDTTHFATLMLAVCTGSGLLVGAILTAMFCVCRHRNILPPKRGYKKLATKDLKRVRKQCKRQSLPGNAASPELVESDVMIKDTVVHAPHNVHNIL